MAVLPQDADLVRELEVADAERSESLVDAGCAREVGEVARVLEQEQGALPATVLLRCRIRYFTEGAVLGSREFVQSHADAWKRSTERKHSPKPRLIKALGKEPLAVLKNLRGSAYS